MEKANRRGFGVNKMTASQQAKQAGLKSLAEVTRMTGQSKETLSNWSRNKPELFHVVIQGCLAIKGADK